MTDVCVQFQVKVLLYVDSWRPFSGEVSPFSPQDVGSTFQNQIVEKWLEIFPIFFQILVEGSFLD